ncbi:MAG: magnesium transporter [Clostridia bacterium]|nr:magnesium transporter [Clostridia bacterium]MBO7289023.1 magnesium transporter [Clostridia bacterium]
MEENINVENQAYELLKSKQYAKLRLLLAETNPADIAEFLKDLTNDELLLAFRILPKDQAADTFVEMESEDQETLIRSFSDSELKAVVNDLFVDDTVDILEEMPANVVKRILRFTDSDTRRSINEILKYPEDSAGSIMTTEYVRLKKNINVSQAISHIRSTGLDKETIYTCYVTDLNNKLIGMVSAKTLLLAHPDEIIEDIMETNVICFTTTDDQEEVAKAFDKYNFMAIPVVDDETRLVGIVTFDDAIDVLQDETTEDIEKMAAIIPSEKSYLKTGVWETWKQRIPWLLLLMISATFTGSIISSYESALASCVILTSFIPMLMDTGGNSGGQSSVTIIRSLSLGDIEMKDLFKIVFKECRVALLCGLTLAIVNFAKMMLLDRAAIVSDGQNALFVSFVVSLTLVVTVFIAKLVGSTLPIAAKKIGFDPAVMASPFITTIVDALSLLVYFNFAKLFLNL